MIRLKELRTAKGMLQREVAEKLNMDRTNYLKYESGAYEPRIDLLWAMADLFGVSVDYLIGRTNEKSPTHEGAELSEVDAELMGLLKRVPPEKRPLLRVFLQAVLSEEQ